MSEDIKNLAAAYVAAQGEISAAIKGSTNPAFKGSKYADLAAVIEAIRPSLAKHGLGFIQEVSEREDGVYVETVIIHKSGETYRTPKLPMPAPKKDPHGYGSAITYAKRYSLQAAFGVPSEDDDGNKAVEGKQAEAAVRFPGANKSAMRGEQVTDEKAAELEKIGQEMVDLVNQELAEKVDNSHGLLERVESLPEAEYLWLWDWLQPHSRVRSRTKAVLEAHRDEGKPPAEASTGIKRYTTRAIPVT